MRQMWFFNCTCVACQKDLVAKRIEYFDYGITLGDLNISVKKVNSRRKLEKWFKAQLQEVLVVSKHESHSKKLLYFLMGYLFPNGEAVNLNFRIVQEKLNGSYKQF